MCPKVLKSVHKAAGVAVTDQSHCRSIKPIQPSKKPFTSSDNNLRPISTVVVAGEEKIKQSDDSLRQVMYLNCWGHT
ncbi:hypothetical protein QVD17_03761 [Tagetes erecta]|uniref:Uncharacterized protein n=1 Tax=Tagetes erecta TaxID=13708 RepID=A0AAD8L8X1_TARER|nr:hypothetical protein QVD17_03761 [Tagetes erecta]